MEDVSNKCRICLRVKKPRKLVSLFDENAKNIMKIFVLTGVKVDDYIDVLPDKICYKCSDSLLDAFQIRNLCIDSDRFLRKQLCDLNVLKLEEPSSDITDEHIIIEQSSVENIEDETKTKTEEDYEEYTNYEILDVDEDYFQDEPEPVEKSIRPRARSKTKKTLDTTNVILSKKYKLIDPKMFETVQPYIIDKTKRPLARQACPVCGLMFRSNYIDKHIETHDETADKYMCDICGKKFKVKNYVYSHMINVHVSNKKHICTYCGKGFSKIYHYREHVRTHQNIRNFPCTYCDKQFFKKRNLDVHTRIHTGVRPYTCEFCERGFIHFTDHKRHVMGHTGERPYKCNICNRGFIKKSELTAHQKTHS